jgi:hypothetical protein
MKRILLNELEWLTRRDLEKLLKEEMGRKK